MPLVKLESWKTVFEVSGVILLLLTFFATAGVVWFSRKINESQAERLRILPSVSVGLELTTTERPAYCLAAAPMSLTRGGIKAIQAPQVGVTWGGLGAGVAVLGPDRKFNESLRDILDTFGELNANVPEPDKNAPELITSIMVGVYPFKKRDMVTVPPRHLP